MDLYLGLGLCLAGVVCIVAGVQGRGSQLFTTVTGQAILGARADNPSAGYTGSTPAGTAPSTQVRTA